LNDTWDVAQKQTIEYNGAMTEKELSVPKEVTALANTLRAKGFEAYLVGGCVRDLLLDREPKDWDITTNARPEEIQALFKETFYENDFGTVGVVTESEDTRLKVIEITPYREEGKYTNARHPDEVHWAKTLDEDLKRRDFTINAIAYEPHEKKLVDARGGQDDIRRKIITTVGEPGERFQEDALRMLRAIRLSAELDFVIESKTAEAIAKNAEELKKISRERVRDELTRTLMSDRPMQALGVAQKLGILPHIIPELEEGVGIKQNKTHDFEVFEHLLRCLQHSADKKWPFEVRLAALLHDVGKPATRRWSDEKKDWTFHGHDVVGARMTKRILQDLHFPKETIEKVVALVRWHMFFSDPDLVTLSAVRRTIRNVGKENIELLLNVRMCDRIGTGRPKEQPFRLRKYMSMIDEAMRDPTTVAMLKIDGSRIMEVTSEAAGPRIGWILHALLEEVLDEPKKNTEEYIENKVQELAKLSDAELKKLGEAGKERREKEDEAAVKKIRSERHVH